MDYISKSSSNEDSAIEGGGECNTPVLTPWYWIAYDVNIFIWSWCGAQGKGPTMDLVSYVSTIKIDIDGLCASQARYVWDIM